MIICSDCGKKNLAQLYCVKCGNDLYGKKRRMERSFVSIFDRPLVVK